MGGRRPWLLLLLVGAACSSGVKALSARFQGPAALAPFAGYTTKRPGELHRYLAVASARGDEIRILDPEDGVTVTSPGLVFPLSVPTPAPVRLASASLGDGGPDLLAVVGEDSSTVGVVTTWDLLSRVAAVGPPDSMALSVDLSADPEIGDGAAILSLAAMTTPASAGGGAPGARVLIGLSDRRLAVIEYARDPADGGLVRLPVTPAASLPKQALGVRPLDIAVEPGGSRLFVATDEGLVDQSGAPVQGVAQVDASQAAGAAWPVVGLDARGPTRLVAAGVFAERTRASSRAYAPPVLHVIAALDESSCGPDRTSDCGLAMMEPDQGTGGVPADPAGELPTRAPIPIVFAGADGKPLGTSTPPLALAMVMPRRPPAPDLPGDVPIGALFDGDPPDRNVSPLLSIYRRPEVSNVDRTAQTTALLAVIAADGWVHLVDPSRWGVVNDADALRGTRYARVTIVIGEPATEHAAIAAFGVYRDVSGKLGLVTPFTGGEDPTATNPRTVQMADEVLVTPGYALDDFWLVEWNGLLPGISGRQAVLQVDAGRFTVAVQGRQDASHDWVATARIWDGSLGVRRGDLAVVSCLDASETTQTFEARVTDFVLPDDLQTPPPASPTYPGGALVLDGDGAGVCQEAPGSPATVALGLRAQGLLLRGTAFGYAGRPELDQPFELRWQDEGPLLLAAQGDPRVDPDGVRQAQETLAIVRKARRKFYPHDGPCGATDTATACAITFPAGVDPAGYDPIAAGPVLRFRIGVACPAAEADCAAHLDAHRLEAAKLGSELGLDIGTSGGLVPSVRRATLVQAMPTAVATVDRSQYASTRSYGTEVYASFLDNEVIYFSPAATTVSSSH